MKKAIIISCVAAVLIYLFVNFKESGIEPIELNNNKLRQEGYDVLQIDEKMKYAGNLILVNRNYEMNDEGLVDDIVLVEDEVHVQGEYQLGSDDVKLSKSVITSFQHMVEHAKEDGITHFILSSGYRNKEKQASLYNEMGPAYALPAGYSEHNVGLSLDIGSSLGKMEDAPEGQWLRKHASDFGFILRYPEDKVDITGIQYEPWHFRYVGLPHSVIMSDHNWVLEEYLDYISENTTLMTSINGEKYIVDYYAFEKELKIKVPSNHSYTISGDNMNGIIVTSVLGGE
ncbi:M15 family metallopeptidase [Paenibacillus endoradicis]|uniref:M15 family metallopeptidase n=1 Tax=Paenibacillus endoradicis TaxID=2972487 RepID=UPI0021591C72|nr:M15 family metallopeptidase [Paenibacillus endoradicis]MCR8659624.1 M15 family metallopeptidase [Paenibacillus endoradicis]